MIEFHRFFPSLNNPLEDQNPNHLQFDRIVWVHSIDDFPEPLLGVITLEQDTSYKLMQSIDLDGNRLFCSGKVGISGESSELCTLSSTLTAGQSMIEVEDSLQLERISLQTSTGAYCVEQTGTGKTNAVSDWFGTNFKGGIAGKITDLDNFIALSCTVLNSDGFEFYGDFNTVAFEICLIQVDNSGEAALWFDTDCRINRRFRYFHGPIISGSGASSFVAVEANFPNPESAIFSWINFSGAGTYLDGISYLSDKLRIRDCRGVPNTARIGQLYWTGNAAETTISVAGTYVKLNATTTLNALSQRFSHSNNRLTYTSAFQTNFVATAIVTMVSGNSQVLKLSIYKNGNYIAGSEQSTTTPAGGTARSENITATALIAMSQNDYIEIFITNATAAQNITGVDGSLLIQEV